MGGFVFFGDDPQNQNAWFALGSDHPFKWRGVRYNTAAHYYLVQMAKAANCGGVVPAILECKTARDARAVSSRIAFRRLHRKLDWCGRRRYVAMRKALGHKIEAHRGVREQLRETGLATIAYANRADRVWGTGIARGDTRRLYDPVRGWRGENEMGKEWMRLRDCLFRFSAPGS